jgi:hypothetical protein
MEMTTSDSSQKNVEEILPYPPSYINRFMGFIQKFPIPYWITYLVLFILHGFINFIFDWVNGFLPAFKFSSAYLIFPLWLWAPLAIMTYLDSTALEAVSNFGPLLDIPTEAMQRLKYEFTTMPARGVIISGFIWTGIYVIFTYLLYPSYVAQGYGTLRIIHTTLDGWVSFVIGYVIIYHTIRQLRLVHRTVKLVKQFDLFQLGPVYAFSVLTSRTGVAWVLLYALTLLIAPIDYSGPVILVAGLSLAAVMMLAAFALPLLVVHQRLVAEKRRLLSEHGQRVKATLAQLHHSVDENEMGDVHQLNSILEGLNIESNILEKIRTWPWRTETFTGFLSAIVLPIILLLIQIAIQKWLNL